LLYPYLNSGEPKIRAGILRVLSRIGDYAAFEKIKPLVSDKDEMVVREAVQAMRILERSRQ
jgi:HEAT repeat protein